MTNQSKPHNDHASEGGAGEGSAGNKGAIFVNYKRLRIFAMFSAVVLIAVACSKPKQEASQVGGEHKGASALDSSAQAPGEKAKPGAAQNVSVSGPASKGYAALNPAADVEQAKRVGRLIHLRSKSYSNPITWAGVTKDTIKLAFALDQSHCGVNIIQLLVQAGANFSPGNRFYRPAAKDQDTEYKNNVEAIQNVVRYWNDHVQDLAADIPEAVEVMKKYNKPGLPLYGRKLAYDLVDSGSFQCPDRTTAAATDIANRIKPFSTVVADVPGLSQVGYNMAAGINAKAPASSRPMTFGLLDPSDKFLSQWAPYVWGSFQSITKMSKLSASWICSRLKGKNAVNSTQFKGTKRKFGLAYPNNPNTNQAVKDFKAFLKADCGLTFDSRTTEFQYNENPARAADEGNQIAVRFQVNGVTSVIYLVDFFGALFHIIDYYKQDYRPEFVWTGTGPQVIDVQRAFTPQEMVDRASIGYTSFGIQGFVYGPGDPFWVYHTYHKVSPKTKKPCDPRSDAGMLHDPDFCRAPGGSPAGAMGYWYYSWLPLLGGLIFAGPNLTPGNVSAGLQAYPFTRYGVDGPTTDPQAVLVGAGPGQYYFITDGSEFRWRSGYVSPPPDQLLGWAEYPDCQRHYLAWPDKLATGWEKGGPNYNAYCGDAKYANFDYRPRNESDRQNGQTCTKSDAADQRDAPPSGHCEKDNYPRWVPIAYR